MFLHLFLKMLSGSRAVVLSSLSMVVDSSFRIC